MNPINERSKALGHRPLVGVGLIAVGAAGAAATAGASRSARNQARDVATANQWAAQVEAAQRQQLADQERDQTQRLQEDQQRFETERANAQAEQQRQLQAAAQQAANEQALGNQNQRVSELTPTVELGGAATGTNSNSEAKRRRATFRPEYSSGVTI